MKHKLPFLSRLLQMVHCTVRPGSCCDESFYLESSCFDTESGEGNRRSDEPHALITNQISNVEVQTEMALCSGFCTGDDSVEQNIQVESCHDECACSTQGTHEPDAKLTKQTVECSHFEIGEPCLQRDKLFGFVATQIGESEGWADEQSNVITKCKAPLIELLLPPLPSLLGSQLHTVPSVVSKMDICSSSKKSGAQYESDVGIQRGSRMHRSELQDFSFSLGMNVDPMLTQRTKHCQRQIKSELVKGSARLGQEQIYKPVEDTKVKTRCDDAWRNRWNTRRSKLLMSQFMAP